MTAPSAPSVPSPYRVTRLTADDLVAAVDSLADMLVDTVAHGASLGFLADLDHAEARRWWLTHADDIAGGRAWVWAAFGADERVVGTVQVRPSDKPNGRHRGEVVKMMVRKDTRGTGLGRRLLTTAEEGAEAEGLTLLVLDTETDSDAEHLYRNCGWLHCGSIPDFATDPRGTLRATTLYAKRLGAPAGE
ncbi:GNAT family N-acetyltransferase [Yinghuangia seranimata]|uniref:GNAT family N-acetyltransferase n=1 Tax=Yinghuangia seranimata TaxID=408067 RepID=UPI00248B3E54|nr:GNAT family N-acetyltransferase [Yinghuangia seranimata]MDI2124922.1 GNAT family N-acetyltransferase [Yinghuangia seranimata]